MTASKLRIAIVGGGVAGASLANALAQCDNLSLQLFESAPKFSERGAAVGLSAFAQRALKLAVADYNGLITQSGAVEMGASRVHMGCGQYQGEEIRDAKSEVPLLVVHRASLLRELLAPLPESILYPNKKLCKIEPQDDSVRLTFEDGHSDTFDAVIGADGIFSFVRKHVIGSDADKPTPAGFWNCVTVVPMELAREKLGDKPFENHIQWARGGGGAYTMTDVVENGTMVQIVMAHVETEHPDDRKQAMSRDDLKVAFHEWLSDPFAHGMIDLLAPDGEVTAYSQWEHLNTSTYTNKHVCIMGDAAHASTPWQGAGAGLAIEDAVILAAVLAKATTAKDIPAAFAVYDAVRRTRGNMLVHNSREAGALICNADKYTPTELKATLDGRWDYLRYFDLAAQRSEVVEKMDALLKE